MVVHAIAILSVQAASQTDNLQREKDFERRLRYHLDLETRDFLTEMSVRETLLLQMIRNITAEIDLRGTRFQSSDLGLLYSGQKNSHLIEQYSRELDQIVTMVDEIETLTNRAEAHGDLHLWRRLGMLRAQLVQAMEKEELHQEMQSSDTRAAILMREQDAEVDSFVRMSEKLESLREMSEAQEDPTFLRLISALQDTVQETLGAFDSTYTDGLVEVYFEEAESLVSTLKELDKLHSRALGFAPDLCIEIQQVRRSILKQLPRRLPTLLGYNHVIRNEDYIPELVNEWKANQYVNYEVRLTRYNIIKQSLINSASPIQLRRMRARELYDAYYNYSRGAYRLAGMQFDRMLKDYGRAHEDVATIHFYRGESMYAQKLLDDAERDYLVLAKKYPDSEYFGESLFRLMQIHEWQPDRGDFFRFFQLVQANRDKIDRETLDKCLYLASYVELEDGDFTAAEQTLTEISPEFTYYWETRLLHGIARAGLGNDTEAIGQFEEIIEAKPANRYIRDSAHLRLGYLHYERGEFGQALQNFDQVSPGFVEYDKTLLAIAWTHLKLKNYASTVETVDLIYKYYLDSEVIYEGLMLSAHAKRLLGDPDGSQEDLRYIANARSVLELSNRYNDERKHVLDQINTLDRLEQRAIEQNDRSTFQIVDTYRSRLQNALLNFEVHGARGNFIFENLETERTKILSQVEQLERLMSKAETSGEKDALLSAQKQRARLMKALQLYRSDTATRSRHYFLDYPLATKEGIAKYRRQVMTELSSEIMREKTKLRTALAQVSALQNELGHNYVEFNEDARLELMHSQLTRLYDRTQWLQSWSQESQPVEPKTDYNRYADFSGFGMSDTTFVAIQQKEEAIAELSSQKNTVAKLILERKQYFEEKVRVYEAEIRRLEREQREEHLQEDLEERQQYLRESYFDTTDSELPENTKPAPGTDDHQQD